VKNTKAILFLFSLAFLITCPLEVLSWAPITHESILNDVIQDRDNRLNPNIKKILQELNIPYPTFHSKIFLLTPNYAHTLSEYSADILKKNSIFFTYILIYLFSSYILLSKVIPAGLYGQ